MKYSDFITINKNFQYSVNIEFDLNNRTKIEEYIPTSDICEVLKKYVFSVLGKTKLRATTLVGPYGKGKSFLLLVLSYILEVKNKDELFDILMDKIFKIDDELYDAINEIAKKQIKLLPVIINSNFDNITQSFQLALNDALKRASLEDIIPNTVFDVCIDLLNRWEKDAEIKDKVLKVCFEMNQIDLKQLKRELKRFSPESYRQFELLYNCVNKGLSFNPLLNNDIVKSYSNIAYEINKRGYNGLFIIFDEFSKFLSSSENISKDLKRIQDFAELANRSSKDEQIHLCCVTHKSMGLYLKSKDEITNNLFKTVEGRFKEVRFNRSLDENYQIIASAIRKTESNGFINEYIRNNAGFYEKISKLGLFEHSKMEEFLFRGCFPLNPLTVYSLVQLSEMVAQNERTLFTFLADTDINSFSSFLSLSSEGLFNVDKIYDYFSDILRNEETNFIKNTWYRCEISLNRTTGSTKEKILKSLAVILMINDYNLLPPNNEILSLAICLDTVETNELIESLINERVLKRNYINNLLSFASVNSKEIEEELKKIYKAKFKNIRVAEFADNVNEQKYLLPRRHNEQNKITRFYKVMFFEEHEFLNLVSFNDIFNSNYCDGIVIYLLRKKITNKQIKNKLSEINDDRIVVKFPKKAIDGFFFEELMKYGGLKEMLLSDMLDEYLRAEIEVLLDETKNDLLILINNYFIEQSDFLHSNFESNSFNNCLSQIMDHIYCKKIVFNNELINKYNVSAQYQKAINNVIEYILEPRNEFPFSETSAENTIINSIINKKDQDGPKEIIEVIKKEIISSEDNKQLISDLVSIIEARPYGVRRGVIPLLFSIAISELSDNFILYLQKKEIDLTAENLVKSIYSEDKYYFSLAKGSNEQRQYLTNLSSLFNVDGTSNFRKDINKVVDKIRKWFIGLPNIIRTATEKNNFLNVDGGIIEFKSLFLTYNINPYDTIFKKPILIFKTSDYTMIYERIENFVNEYEKQLLGFKKDLITLVKRELSFPANGSIKSGVERWISDFESKKKIPIFEGSNRKIYETIKNDMTYDDCLAINDISKAITGVFIEDWDEDRREELVKKIVDFSQVVASMNLSSEGFDHLVIEDLLDELANVDSTPTGKLFRNNIESLFSEFGGSVTNAEKIAILSSILKEML